MKLHAESGRKGVMNIDGQVMPTGPAAQLQLDLRELDIAPLQPYMADRFNAALRSGTMTLKGKVAYEAPAGKPIAVRFNGNAVTCVRWTVSPATTSCAGARWP
jgi:hypothetical protein